MKPMDKQSSCWSRVPIIGMLLVCWCATAWSQEMMRFPRLQPVQVRRAAEEHNAHALYIYGSLLLHGSAGQPGRPAEALPYIERAAELGVSRAQLAAAALYHLGEVVPQNDAKALQWYRQAALQGMPEAQFGLARLYEQGIGTAVNLFEAARWYGAAAMQGHAASQAKLGSFYLQGRGLKADELTGYMWLTLSAANAYRPGIEARDAAREQLDPATIAQAQQLAATFSPQPHYNTNLLKREEAELKALAEKLAENPLTETSPF